MPGLPMPKTPRLLRPGKCRFGQGGCRRCGFRDHRHRQDDAASATAVTGAEPEDPARRLAAQGDPDSPGVFYVTADPWGNNEQNAQIFIHGFNYQQLGYTLDGLPLGTRTTATTTVLRPSVRSFPKTPGARSFRLVQAIWHRLRPAIWVARSKPSRPIPRPIWP
jgi:hypothetical protein